MDKQTTPAPVVPISRRYMTPWQEHYLAARTAWCRANPHASIADYERACERIKKLLGI